MRKHIRTLGIIGAALIVGGLVYRFGFFSRARPNVILIVLDTFRADRLAAYGATQGLTPFLDRWAAQSTVYEHAYAASSWTVPSVATLLLAQYPSEHQLIRMTSVLPDSKRTLTEVLRDHGFHTGGFSGNMQISRKTGFGQGFDTFKLLVSPNLVKGDAQQLNQAALQWLAQRSPADPPFFLYLQYMDTHSPYREHAGLTPPRAPTLHTSDSDLNKRVTDGSFAAAFGDHHPWHFDPAEMQRLLDLYDGEVRYLDRRVGEFLSNLAQRGVLRHTLVIITADHGEQFGEHEILSHGVSLYESAIHIPLIVRLPDQSSAAQFTVPVELAGLAPALLERFEIPRPTEFHIPPMPLGDSTAHTRASTPIFSELLKSHPQDFRLHRYALIDGSRKVLVTETGDWVYEDLATDPQENHPLTAAPFAEQLRQSLAHVTSTLSAPSDPQQDKPIEDHTRERLHSLGYAN